MHWLNCSNRGDNIRSVIKIDAHRCDAELLDAIRTEMRLLDAIGTEMLLLDVIGAEMLDPLHRSMLTAVMRMKRG